MKKYIYVTFFLAIIMCSSCVSKDKYDALENDMNKLEKEYDNLVDEYNALVNKYNSLNDDYEEIKSEANTIMNNFNRLRSNANSIVDDYNDLQYKANIYARIIRSAQQDADKLKKDFNSYKNDWVQASVVDRDIRNLINTLDGSF